MSWDFSRETRVKKSRKAHRCIMCGKLIRQGRPYIRQSGVWDGGFQSLAAHNACEAIYRELNADVYPGDWCYPLDYPEEAALAAIRCGKYLHAYLHGMLGIRDEVSERVRRKRPVK